ncbi:MAG: hypothetical protein ACRDZQ_02835 [Acidimicrobiales bacterium]
MPVVEPAVVVELVGVPAVVVERLVVEVVGDGWAVAGVLVAGAMVEEPPVVEGPGGLLLAEQAASPTARAGTAKLRVRIRAQRGNRALLHGRHAHQLVT